MKKVNLKAALLLAISFVLTNVVTSCSEQKSVPGEDRIIYTPGPSTTVHDTLTNVLDNMLMWDGQSMFFNGQTALTAWVTPDKKVIDMPAANHKAAEIATSAPNRWTDTNSNGFTGTVNQTTLKGLILTADIEPATPFSYIDSLHPKVSMVVGAFKLNGIATIEETGRTKTFSLPVADGIYFLSDSTTDVRIIDHETIKIEWRDSIVVKDSIIYVPQTEYIHINHNKDGYVVNGFGFGKIVFTVDDKSFTFDLNLKETNILREENLWGIAAKESESRNGFNLSDTQVGTYSIVENGINLEDVSFGGVSFTTLMDPFKYGTTTVNVSVSYNDENGEKVMKNFSVSASYFHSKEIKAEPEVVTPEITTEHVYEVDTVRVDVKDSDGHLTGGKMRITIKKDGEVWYKAQYMIWETGLATGTITGTQVGNNQQLRATSYGTPEEYKVEGWWGEENVKGATTTAYSLQYHFRTAFTKVPGFGQSEESVAETNLVFGKRDFYLKDAETGWELSIPAGDLKVVITEDMVGTDEAAQNEINARGLEYTYCGTHFLSFDQFVGGVKVNSQSRSEHLLSPKN